jgi:hypothetical protein
MDRRPLNGAVGTAGGITLLLAVGLAACRGEAPRTLTVIVDIGQPGSICQSQTGMDLAGDRVAIRDGAGAIVGQGTLGPGAPPTDPPISRTRVCRFQTSVHVPDRAAYSVRVDDGDQITYSREDLERTPLPWVVSYTGLRGGD